RPAALAAYVVIATMLTPLFAILASCDQTATDLGTRHIRFLIPRVGRAEIFVSRLVAAAIVIGVAQLLAGIAATIVALVVHGVPGWRRRSPPARGRSRTWRCTCSWAGRCFGRGTPDAGDADHRDEGTRARLRPEARARFHRSRARGGRADWPGRAERRREDDVL